MAGALFGLDPVDAPEPEHFGSLVIYAPDTLAALDAYKKEHARGGAR
jgi:hypothetical protein